MEGTVVRTGIRIRSRTLRVIRSILFIFFLLFSSYITNVIYARSKSDIIAPQRKVRKSNTRTPKPSWLDSLRADSRSWNVTEAPFGINGSSVFSYKRNYACFLMLQNVCSTHRGSHSGGWYSLDGHDLSRLNSTVDVCGYTNRSVPRGFTSLAKSNLFQVQDKQGVFLPDSFQPPGSPVWMAEEVFVSPHDVFLGHFVERIGILAEVATAVRSSLQNPGFIFPSATVAFPTSTYETPSTIQGSKFTLNVVQALFGSKSSILGLKSESPSSFCFKRVFFPINSVFTQESMDNFRDRIYSKLSPSQRFGNIGTSCSQYQVTWIWRSNRRTIENSGKVMDLLLHHFKGIPVVSLEPEENDNFMDSVAMFRRTAMLFGMHGSAFANLVFLPKRAHVFELLPLHFDYIPYKRLCDVLGYSYHKWQNKNIRNHDTDDGCYPKEWRNFTTWQCSRNVKCRRCVRDHSITIVDLTEMNATLALVVPQVRELIAKQCTIA